MTAAGVVQWHGRHPAAHLPRRGLAAFRAPKASSRWLPHRVARLVQRQEDLVHNNNADRGVPRHGRRRPRGQPPYIGPGAAARSRWATWRVTPALPDRVRCHGEAWGSWRKKAITTWSRARWWWGIGSATAVYDPRRGTSPAARPTWTGAPCNWCSPMGRRWLRDRARHAGAGGGGVAGIRQRYRTISYVHGPEDHPGAEHRFTASARISTVTARSGAHQGTDVDAAQALSTGSQRRATMSIRP